MNLEQRIKAFTSLGLHMQQISDEALSALIDSVRQENPWFTADNIQKALGGISGFLDQKT